MGKELTVFFNIVIKEELALGCTRGLRNVPDNSSDTPSPFDGESSHFQEKLIDELLAKPRRRS